MSSYTQFLKLAVPLGARERAELQMDEINPQWREERPMAWAGLAAEEALVDAYAPTQSRMRRSESRLYDLVISDWARSTPLRIEVKTRAVDSGWTDPRMFEWFYVPSHDGREPIKDVDMVFFAWYSGSVPEILWLLGYFAGLTEFKRRVQFYAENQPLPRGGWAGKGGGYCLEIKNLRPIPAGMFREVCDA